jgi:glucose/arabinose dehydrogenase
LLYIAIGDGGSSGDPKGNAQRTDVLLGKVLRIDPKPSAGLPYSIPPENPFAGRGASSLGTVKTVKARPEIIAFGLRNPWRATVDAETGDVWIPDVGESSVEEINRIPTGSRSAFNFGWSLREGRQSFKGPRPKNSVEPVFDYPHADGRCSVVGGVVYRGSAIPALQGRYVFGDVCSGRIQVLDDPMPGRGRASDLGARVSYLTSFGVGPDGELVATSLEGGLYRIVPAPA